MSAPLRRLGLALLSALLPAAAGAEDIDLYTSVNAQSTAPNILMVLDNTSNWSGAKWYYSNSGQSQGAYEACGTNRECQGYVNHIFFNAALTDWTKRNANPVPQLDQGQIEARVIKLVLNRLVCQSTKPISINVGVQMFANATTGAFQSSNANPGYIRWAVSPLTSTYCSALTADLDAIATSLNTTQGPSSASYGELFFEAFKYFGGYTNPANAINNAPAVANDGAGTTGRNRFGNQPYTDDTSQGDVNAMNSPTNLSSRTYISPINTLSSCGNNFIILIGNKYPDGDAPSTSTLLPNLGYPTTPICCAGSNANQNVLADVWAKFLSTTDVSSVAGQQPVFTYALNVFPPGGVDPNQRKLFQSIALNGGTGAAGYYEVNGNLSDLVNGLTDIFISIAAKNSVFAAASLPVSVNAQGIFLNQIFMGLFRPDPNAYPRWNGNLKQYRFATFEDEGEITALFLAGADGKAVIDAANTGFISTCAQSYWTSDTSDWNSSGKAYWERVPTSQTPESACTKAPYSSNSTFSDEPDGGIVEKGGAAQWLRARNCSAGSPCGRIIHSCASAAPNQCDSSANVVNFNATSITGLGATYINWAAGQNVGDGPPNLNGLYQFYNGLTQSAPDNFTRPTIHGDVVHSRPLAINYGTTSNDIVVFYGAGDGMLRAVDGNRTAVNANTTAGQELWAFVAPEFHAKLQRLRENSPLIAFPTISTDRTPTPTPRDWFFDGSISAYQARNASGVSKVWLYASMRRGGRMLYAFDASTRPLATSATAPTLKWRFGCPDNTSSNCTAGTAGTAVDKIGQTWSTPRAIRVKGRASPWLVFGGGYDACEDVDNQVSGTGRCGTAGTRGQGIYVLDADQGPAANTYYLDLTLSANGGSAATTGRVVADVVPVDSNSDGYTDLLYAVDTRGNVWRINVTEPAAGATTVPTPDSWVVQKIAYVADFASTVSARKFMYAPDVVVLGSRAVVLVGSGDREHPLGNSTAASTKNRFYGIFDDHATTVSAPINGNDCDAPNDTTLTAGCGLLDVSEAGLSYASVFSGTAVRGWMFRIGENCSGGVCTVNTSTGTPTEQVVTTPTTIGGVTYFSTFQPSDPNPPPGTCTNLGTPRGYAVNFLTGLPLANSTRSEIFLNTGGFPPSPVSGVVELSADKLVTFVLGAKGNSPLDATLLPISVDRVRRQVYRYPKIDAQ